jgi:RNA polymerase sigma-70 factor (ECF subfamily)
MSPGNITQVFKRRNALILSGPELSLPPLWSTEKGPESQAVSLSLQAALEAAIAALPDTYRLVVMLRDVQGLSTAEAAECLEVSEAVVKVRLHRGRAMLRREIAARSGEPENDAWVLDFSEWASVYRTWLTRQAEYRNEIDRLQGGSPNVKG